MTPCRGDNRFTSDDPFEREAAKALCNGCPVRAACEAGAEERGETWGVWAGRDRGVVELAEPTAYVRPQVFAPQHNRARYVSGCRCDVCTESNRQFIARWREEHRFAAVVEHAPMPEQLDLFAQVGAVTTGTKVDA